MGSIPDFLVLMVTDPAYVREMFAVRTETALANLEKARASPGDNIDMLGLDGTDYGSQNAELFSPELFAELYAPFFEIQNDWVHRHTRWKTWLHTLRVGDRILPAAGRGGVDILNPVQTSAAGMDPAWLKRTFGKKIVFWGGGVDTQRTLPFFTPEEVAAQVRERIRLFAPGGGFVFNPIHNVQQGTPPANIAAAYDTARAAGRYPLGADRPPRPSYGHSTSARIRSRVRSRSSSIVRRATVSAGMTSPKRSFSGPGRMCQERLLFRLKRPDMPTGTTSTPACLASRNGIRLNGLRRPSIVRVPSGMMITDSVPRKAADGLTEAPHRGEHVLPADRDAAEAAERQAVQRPAELPLRFHRPHDPRHPPADERHVEQADVVGHVEVGPPRIQGARALHPHRDEQEQEQPAQDALDQRARRRPRAGTGRPR